MILSIILSILFVFTCSPCHALGSEHWVAISYIYGYVDGNPSTEEVIGRISNDDYNQIINADSESSHGMIILADSIWNNGTNPLPASVAAEKWGYSNTVLIKISNILRVIPLTEKKVMSIHELLKIHEITD